jgi:hypothetical protein
MAYPLSGFGSLSEFHQYATTNQTVTPERIALVRPYRGFFPFSVCQSRRATYPRRFPPHRLRCALRVSHPLDALLPSRPSGLVPSRYRSWGFPLRGFDPHPLPYALSSAAPLRISPSIRRRGRPSRDSHNGQSPSPVLVVSQDPAGGCLLGLSRSEVSCSQQWRTLPRPLIPSRASSARSQAGLAAGTPGFFAARNAAVLSRDQ